MRRFLAISCLLSLAIQPATAQPRKEAVSFAIPGAILSAPLPISRRPSTITHKEIRDLSRSGYPRTHFQRGMYYRQKGDLNSALIEFLKATQENPRLVKAFYEQSLIFHQRGYLKLAESALEQALAVDADYKQARVLLATIRLAQGNVGGAVSELSRSLGLPESKKQPVNLDNEVPQQTAEELEEREFDRPAPPPSLLQVLHDILPEPPHAENQPVPTVQNAAPVVEQPAPTERKTGFAGLPNPPTAERKVTAPGELDDLLKGIPGLDPDLPAPQATANSQAASQASAAPSATPDAADKKDLATKSAPAKKSFFHFHIANPLSASLSLFKNPNPKTDPPAPPKAERLEKKAEKFKVKAENLRERADKLSPAKNNSGSQVPLSTEPESHATKKLAKTVEENTKKAGTERQDQRPNRVKKNRGGIFAGLFTFFESSEPEAPTSESKTAKSASTAAESEPLAMVVRQPLTADGDTATATARRHLPIPARKQRHAIVTPAPAAFASLSQLKQHAIPPLPTPQNQAASINAPVPPRRSADSNPSFAPLPVPQNNLSRTLVIETPVQPKPSSPKNRATGFSPLPAALKSLGISIGQAPAPKATENNQYTAAPTPMEITSYVASVPALKMPATAPAAKVDKTPAPSPVRVPASLLDPAIMSFAASNAAKQKAIAAASKQQSQPAPAAAAVKPLPSLANTLPEQPPIKSQLVYSPPAAVTLPPAPSAPLAVASGFAPPVVPAMQSNPAGTSSGKRPFQSPLLPSGQMRWLSLPSNAQQQARASERPKAGAAPGPAAPDEDPWTKRLQYLSEHGTASLKPGEAFMFSEESGEAVLFMAKGETIRRKVAQPQDPEEVVRARRPDILIPQELQYNLSLLGKLLPKLPDQQQGQQSSGSAPLSNFNVSDVLRDSNRFWDWLKQSVRF
jgi:tetratricopeptide (TPR) repeat protein